MKESKNKCLSRVTQIKASNQDSKAINLSELYQMYAIKPQIASAVCVCMCVWLQLRHTFWLSLISLWISGLTTVLVMDLRTEGRLKLKAEDSSLPTNCHS